MWCGVRLMALPGVQSWVPHVGLAGGGVCSVGVVGGDDGFGAGSGRSQRLQSGDPDVAMEFAQVVTGGEQ
jgi:hypothetical protein